MTLDRYRHLLQTHDWSYDFSEDHSVWRRGHTQRQELVSLQILLDPDCHIWNSLAPQDYRKAPHA